MQKFTLNTNKAGTALMALSIQLLAAGSQAQGK